MNFVVRLVILMGEEIGWRGFMLPRIQQLTTKRRAALVTGFVHGLFHLPLILIATTYDTVGPRWIAAPVAVLTIAAAGVFYAWLWDRSHSSWAPGIGHICANMAFDFGLRRRRLDHLGEPGPRGRRDRGRDPRCRRGPGSGPADAGQGLEDARGVHRERHRPRGRRSQQVVLSRVTPLPDLHTSSSSSMADVRVQSNSVAVGDLSRS